MEVILQTVVGIQGGIGELNHLLQVTLVDARHLVALGIILAISLIEIYLGKESSGGSTGGTSFLLLYFGQRVIGFHQVIDDELPTLVVGVLGVGQLVILVIGQVLVDDKGDVLVQTLEQEVAIGTQELHLGQALRLHVVAVVSLLEQSNGTVHARQAVVQPYPHVINVPVGGEYTLLDFKLMEHVTVAGTVTTLVGIITTDVKVPHRE